jgi:hypothetical protein
MRKTDPVMIFEAIFGGAGPVPAAGARGLSIPQKKAAARDAGVSEDKIERALRTIAEAAWKPRPRRFH